jgi:hypothetical protein
LRWPVRRCDPVFTECVEIRSSTTALIPGIVRQGKTFESMLSNVLLCHVCCQKWLFLYCDVSAESVRIVRERDKDRRWALSSPLYIRIIIQNHFSPTCIISWPVCSLSAKTLFESHGSNGVPCRSSLRPPQLMANPLVPRI